MSYRLKGFGILHYSIPLDLLKITIRRIQYVQTPETRIGKHTSYNKCADLEYGLKLETSQEAVMEERLELDLVSTKCRPNRLFVPKNC